MFDSYPVQHAAPPHQLPRPKLFSRPHSFSNNRASIKCRWCKNRITVTSLPFCSTFNRGAGQHYRMNGTIALANPWINLSLQDIQPQWLQHGRTFLKASKAPFQNSQTTTAFEGGLGYRCCVDLRPGAMWLEALFACMCPLPPKLDVTYTCAGGDSLTQHCALLLYLNYTESTAQEGADREKCTSRICAITAYLSTQLYVFVLLH
jgi:hypothetical protein